MFLHNLQHMLNRHVYLEPIYFNKLSSSPAHHVENHLKPYSIEQNILDI